MKMNTRNTIVAVVGSMGLAAGAMATPQFTTVNPPPSGEKGHGYILGQIFGGTFTKTANGLDYSNSILTAQRLADSGTGLPTSLSTPAAGLTEDDKWTGPAFTTITAEAKYAAHNSTFGYFDDTVENPTFIPIFNTSNFDQPVSLNLPATFRWAIRNNNTGKTLTSDPADNIESKKPHDQLVTYSIQGLSQGTREWVLFWEDLTPNDCSDYDFNDSAITITTKPLIPAPGSAGLMLAGLGLMAKRRRR